MTTTYIQQQDNKLMNSSLNDYLLHLYNTQKNKNMHKHLDKRVLTEFIINKKTNIYQCHKSILEKHKKTGYTTTYKTIHTKVHELALLGIIEKTSSENLDHGATEYQLSTYGLYYILNYTEIPIHGLRYNHPDDPLFELFLYPYIEKQTISEMTGFYIDDLIINFLRQVCKSISTKLGKMGEIEFQGGVYYYRGSTTNLLDTSNIEMDYELDTKYSLGSFLRYLEENLDIKWSNISQIKTESIKGYEIMKIFDNEKEITIKVIPKKNKALLLKDGELIFEFYAREHGKQNNYFLLEFDPMSVKDYLEIENPEVFEPLEIPILEFCWNIVKYYDPFDDSFYMIYQYKDISLLKKDKSFKKSLGTVKKDIEDKLSRIDELMNNLT